MYQIPKDIKTKNSTEGFQFTYQNGLIFKFDTSFYEFFMVLVSINVIVKLSFAGSKTLIENLQEMWQNLVTVAAALYLS